MKDMIHVSDQFLILFDFKEIKRIFQRVREIMDVKQEKNRAQNAALMNSSMDRKRG